MEDREAKQSDEELAVLMGEAATFKGPTRAKKKMVELRQLL